MAKAKEQGVVHTELAFETQTYQARGIPFAAVMEGMIAVQQEAASLGISVGLLLTFVRDEPVDNAIAILKNSLPYQQHITGIGLASTEQGFPPSLFAKLFAMAKELGYRRSCHAGEEGDATFIWQALAIGAERIDHGIHCLQDPKLVAYLQEQQIPITICPLSNIALQVTPDLEHHPIAQMMALGLNVSINSDDPAYFGGYIGENYRALAKQQIISEKQLIQCAINSARGAFIPYQQQQAIIDQILHYTKKI